jgi:hypothetical protein
MLRTTAIPRRYLEEDIELQIQERVSWNTKERTQTEHRILPSTLSLSQWVGFVEVVVGENTTPLKSDTEYLLSVKVLQRKLILVKHNLYFVNYNKHEVHPH